MRRDRLRLDKQQLQFFDTFGFLRLPGMFADDVGSIINHRSGPTMAVATTVGRTNSTRGLALSDSSTRTKTCASCSTIPG